MGPSCGCCWEQLVGALSAVASLVCGSCKRMLLLLEKRKLLVLENFLGSSYFWSMYRVQCLLTQKVTDVLELGIVWVPDH